MTTPRFRTVIFDCDSTLSAIEGIDELAAGHREAIAALTDAAMRGEVPLEAVYGQRLELIRPNRDSVDALAAQYIAAAVPDAHATIQALLERGVRVKILSGGLRQAILPFAAWLGVAADDVAAVDAPVQCRRELTGASTSDRRSPVPAGSAPSWKGGGGPCRPRS